MTETWAYASSTSINVTASPAEDLRTKYWPGQWVKITQTTDKFFLITATSYASPVTTLTVYGGGTYTVANAAITAHSYSIDQAPKDIPYTFRRFPYKLDDLDAPDDNTDLDASTTAHGLMSKLPGTKQRLKGDGGWADPYFTAPFQFGDGQSVILAQAKTKQIPMASKIIAAKIRSIDNAAALKSGSITCTVYIHDYNTGIGTAIDSFALSSASSYSETGLNISIGSDQFISVVVSGITDVTNVSLNLKLEAT